MNKHKKKHNIRNIITSHINNNIKEYATVTIVLLIGVIFGVIALNNANDSQKVEIQTYIQQFITNIQGDYDIDKLTLLKEVIINNLALAIGLVFFRINSYRYTNRLCNSRV